MGDESKQEIGNALAVMNLWLAQHEHAQTRGIGSGMIAPEYATNMALYAILLHLRDSNGQ